MALVEENQQTKHLGEGRAATHELLEVEGMSEGGRG